MLFTRSQNRLSTNPSSAARRLTGLAAKLLRSPRDPTSGSAGDEKPTASRFLLPQLMYAAYRRLIRLPSASLAGGISQVIALPIFGWLLVVFAGQLLAFDVKVLIPNHLPEMWEAKGGKDASELSKAEEGPVGLVRVGRVKGRLLGESRSR